MFRQMEHQTARQPGTTTPPHPASNPFLDILQGLLPADLRNYALSDEQLDQIIFNTSGDAPPRGAPPANADAIAALPRRKLDASMLDDKGTAECTICQEEVGAGEEVAVLYCKHWFHYTCIKMWLDEHDACPHCRMSLAESRATCSEDNAPSSPCNESAPDISTNSHHSSRSSSRRRSMQGSNGLERRASNASRRASYVERLRDLRDRFR
jgi:E3 ubiquitin-protein ligase RNF115/126